MNNYGGGGGQNNGPPRQQNLSSFYQQFHSSHNPGQSPQNYQGPPRGQYQQGRQPSYGQPSYSQSPQGPYGQNDQSQNFTPPNKKPKYQQSPASNQSGGRTKNTQLESVSQDCIDRLADSKTYVSVERIEELILQHYNVTRLRDINVRNIEQIQCVFEHMRKQGKVNTYIQGFVRIRTICTLHELHEGVKEFMVADEFDSLQLGPFLLQPLIYQYFKMRKESEIPEIDTSDILDYLRDFLNSENQWSNRDVPLEDFMKFIMKTRGITDPYDLGIRIRSMSLAIGVLKRSQGEVGKCLRECTKRMKDSVENDICAAFKHFSSQLFEKTPGISCQLKPKYVDEPFHIVFANFFTKAQLMLDSLCFLTEQHLPNFRGNKDLKAQALAIDNLRKEVHKDQFLQRLLHLAIVVQKEEIHSSLIELVNGWTGRKTPDPSNKSKEVVQVDSSSSEDDSSDDEDANPGTNKPDITKLAESIKQYIERCLALGPLTLIVLSKIEKKLLSDYDKKSFSVLGEGNFLEFLVNNQTIKQMLEKCGGSLMGQTTGGAENGGKSGYQATVADLMEFVRQCGPKGEAEVAWIEGALCHHFRLANVADLGLGSTNHIIDYTEQQTKNRQESRVFFESSLCVQSKSVLLKPERKVGLMGSVTKEKAIACLQNCPLLEDLNEWSHWDLLFRPELGDIKPFIKKFGGVHSLAVTDESTSEKFNFVSNILALETKPGEFLKLSCNTSIETFAEAVSCGDATNASGHLASLVANHNGLKNLPQALLGNHVRIGLAKIQADAISDSSKSTKFVLACLARLPLLMCEAVAAKVFLEPLAFVIGSSKSKEELLRCADTDKQRGRLHILGYLLGINEWCTDMQARLALPKGCLTQIQQPVSISASKDKPIQVDAKDEASINSETASSKDGRVKTDSKPVEEIVIDSTSEGDENKDGTQLADDAIVVSDTPMDTDDSLESKCKKVVNNIRHDEFGVDVILSEDGMKLMTKQHERLGRSLDRLSKDLYSKDTHFVLELIQNADDNSYPDSMLNGEIGECATVHFIVDANRVIVRNNERGFSERDIRALCDVGTSTKGKHKYGYIGQKGIGFKSVFRVTDRPEIHSNGYHICFDVNSGPTGYILPHWVDQSEHTQDSNWTTQIILPLKNKMMSISNDGSLAARFQDLHPSLLLFLHRLQAIHVSNNVENYEIQMRKTLHENNVVEIKYGENVDKWLVLKKILDASKISLEAKSGVDVESTEISIAFPVLPKGTANSLAQLKKQPVFAFLPLRSYGFKFIIQGDFDVPSSREDIDSDSVWNQWLRDAFHVLFYDAFENFKTLDDSSPIEALCSFLMFIPLEDEISDFFRPLASHIIQLLKSKPFLPSEPDDHDDVTSVKWLLPSQLLISHDPVISQVFPGNDMQTHLNLNYLNEAVAMVMPPQLTRSLGIQTINSQHLVDCGKLVLKQWRKGDDYVLRIAKWLSCIYKSLDEFHQNQTILEELRQITMIPMADGSVASLSEKSVFFSLAGKSRKKGKKDDILCVLESDMSTVDPQLLACQDSVANSQVLRLLELIGVKHLAPADIIHHHIIPILKDEETWKQKSQQMHIAYLTYIKEQHDRDPNILSMAEFKPLAVIITNTGFCKPNEDTVHFTKDYGNKFDLPVVFPGYDWVLLDSVYLNGLSTQYQLLRWRDFFVRLGVVDFLAVELDEVELSADDLQSSPWGHYLDNLPKLDVYKIRDFKCPELFSLVTDNGTPNKLYDQMKSLFDAMESQWDNVFCRYTSTSISDKHGNSITEVETSFSILLKMLDWLPYYYLKKEVVNDEVEINKKTGVTTGKDLFIKTRETTEILGDNLNYLDFQPSHRSGLVTFLGIRDTFDVNFVVENLIKWCKTADIASEADEPEPKTFCSSLAHMKNVYNYLFNELPPKSLNDLFFNHPCIFVVPEVPRNHKVVCQGTFLKRTHVRWADQTGLFDKYKQSLMTKNFKEICRLQLADQYPEPEFREFFIRYANIQEFPNMDEYLELASLLAQTQPYSKVLPDVLVLFTIIGEIMSKSITPGLQNQTLNKVKEMFVRERMLPVKGNKFVSGSDKPLISDDKKMEKMFHGKPNVHFIDFGTKFGITETQSHHEGVYVATVKQLFTDMGIKRLSDVIDVESVTTMYKPCLTLQQYMHDITPYIQKLLIKEYPDVYERLKNENIKQKLGTMLFGEVDGLELVYRISFLPNVNVVKPEASRMNDEQFCVQKDHVSSYFEINYELARFYSKGDPKCLRAVKGFLFEIQPPLLSNSTYALARILDDHELSILPPGEEEWQVPEPVYPTYEPEPEYVEPEPEVTEQPDDSAVKSENVEEKKDVVKKDGDQMRCWPPKASSGGAFKGSGGKSSWPPPAPTKDVIDKVTLPENLRPSRFAKSKGTEESMDQDDQGKVMRNESNVNEDDGEIMDDDEGGQVVAAPRRALRSGPESQETVTENAEKPRMEEDIGSSSDFDSEDDGSDGRDGSRRTPRSRNESPSASRGYKRVRTNSGSVVPVSVAQDKQLIKRDFPSMPTWSAEMDPMVYVPLDKPQFNIPDNFKFLESTQTNPNIGLWGEYFVKSYLEHVRDTDENIIDVKWMNGDEDAQQPYDFVMFERNPVTRDIREIYIEVKSTVNDQKSGFDISSQQISMAQQLRERFHIYRVFNAGKENDAKLTKLENVANLLYRKAIRLYLIV